MVEACFPLEPSLIIDAGLLNVWDGEGYGKPDWSRQCV